MAQSAKSLRFVLSEDGTSVRAVLTIDGSRILQFENEQAPHVSIRHPRVNEKELRKMAEYWSHPDRALKDSPSAVLDAYIGSRERGIAKQMLAIRKALRKIAGSVRNATIARNVRKRLRT